MSDNSSSSGIGFTGLLQVAFIVLKLCKVIAWSWWWVLAPSWIGAAILIGCLLGLCVVWYAAKKHGDWVRQKRIETNDRLKKEVNDFAMNSKWQERLNELQKSKRV